MSQRSTFGAIVCFVAMAILRTDGAINWYGPQCRLNATRRTDQFSITELNELLDRHNYARAGVRAASMPVLRWNYALSDVAAAWASSCSRSPQPFAERTNKGGFAQVGQVVVPSYSGIQSAMDELLQSGPHWSNSPSPGSCSLPLPGACSAYTQIVWAATTDVGCSASSCAGQGGAVFTCAYGPAGNVVGRVPYVDGDPPDGCQLSAGPQPKTADPVWKKALYGLLGTLGVCGVLMGYFVQGGGGGGCCGGQSEKARRNTKFEASREGAENLVGGGDSPRRLSPRGRADSV
jgi:pathogenesis-related protein 1